MICERLEVLRQKIQAEAPCEIFFESAVDTKPLFERALAQRAGLGFIGKQTQLLSLEFGPWLFLSELMTSLELEPDEPFAGSCGSCRICIDECPTQAIEETGGLHHFFGGQPATTALAGKPATTALAGKPADALVAGGIDARKCISYLTIEHKTEIPEELRSKIGDRVFGCDECLNVCPYTAKQKETNWKELTATPSPLPSPPVRGRGEGEGEKSPADLIMETAGIGPELDLSMLFRIKSNREYKRKFGRTALSRASRKQLLRNARVALANSGSCGRVNTA